jgi:hypothetical protein
MNDRTFSRKEPGEWTMPDTSAYRRAPCRGEGAECRSADRLVDSRPGAGPAGIVAMASSIMHRAHEGN